jgi:hypothetical protein
MSNISTLTSAQLRKAAEIQEQIEALSHELATVLNGSTVPVPQSVPEAEPEAVIQPFKTRKKYKLSAAGRAAKIAALKARFAKANAAKTEAEPVKKRRKSKFSAAGLARLKAAQKARWAKFHAAKAGKSEKK